MNELKQCEHRYLASHGRGWECADCGVGILSLAVPLPLPLVAEALRAIAGAPTVGLSAATAKEPSQ